MNRSIDAGPGLLAFGGLLLVISLFLPWFDGSSAFTLFETLDVILLLLGLAAIAVGAARVGEDPRAGLAIAGVALLFVAVTLIDPSAGDEDYGAGSWIGLVATLLMLGGATMTVASFSVSVDVRGRERRRRVAAVDRRAERAERAERESAPEPAAAEPDPEPTSAAAPDPSSFAARRRSLMEDDQRTQAMPVIDPDEDPDRTA